jgi:hypothetical protein
VGIWNPYPVPGKLKGTAAQNKFDNNGNKIYGKYTSKSYDKKKDLDCSVTYTCAYGEGFDKVWDNQRYGITEVRAGRTSYNMRDDYWLPTGLAVLAGMLSQSHETTYDNGVDKRKKNFCDVESYPSVRCYCSGQDKASC